MRMWMIEPEIMCDKHLLGEHVECHMFVGCINKGKSIKGYIDKGLVETQNIKNRHDEIVKTMLRRGMKHNSPLQYVDKINKGYVSVPSNIDELRNRCGRCREIIEIYDSL
jgi:hypothetical protein